MLEDGHLEDLLNEGKATQNSMTKKKNDKPGDRNEERIIKLMEKGNISAIFRYIVSLQCGLHVISPDVLRVCRKLRRS